MPAVVCTEQNATMLVDDAVAVIAAAVISVVMIDDSDCDIGL